MGLCPSDARKAENEAFAKKDVVIKTVLLPMSIFSDAIVKVEYCRAVKEEIKKLESTDPVLSRFDDDLLFQYCRRLR